MSKNPLERIAVSFERIAAAWEDIAETAHELPAIFPSEQKIVGPAETKVVVPDEIKEEVKPKRKRRTKKEIQEAIDVAEEHNEKIDAAEAEVKATAESKAAAEVEAKTKAETTDISIDEVRHALIKFVKDGGNTTAIKQQAKEIIATEGDGANKISEIPEAKYQEVLDALGGDTNEA